ncbi:MAG TPA: hypothetical protein VH206_14300 [Xanthobacteraceae bacterium]|jgi:hypothetical protein|nr:hypothetical protein [Xanthobacteraceae bacterium]
MTLEFEIDSLDSLPEPLREHYAPHDGGKFRLAVENLPEPMGLKSALDKERDNNKAFKRFGKTPAAIQALLDREADVAAKSANLETLTRQAAASAEQETAKIHAELNIARANERAAIVGATIAAALGNAKATAEGHDLLSDRLSARVQLETKEGKRVATILGRDGKTPMLVSGKPASFADLVRDAKAQFPSLFEGTGAGGGGTPPRQGAAPKNVITRTEFDAMPAYERAAKLRSGVRLVD